ncbi:MAG: hypothetical protein WCF18_03475 [Chthoniobacteraceae bacterium]
MHNEFLSLTKALNVPLLSEDEIADLHRLQKQWEHWAHRERQHAAARVVEEQQAAFTAFIDNPTAETEQKLLVTADADLTGRRYATLRRACAALRGRISAEAARIIRPAIDRTLESLRAEHAHRREVAEPVMSSKDRARSVIEARLAVESAESIATRLLWASDGTSDKTPLELASVLIGEAKDLTAEDGQ